VVLQAIHSENPGDLDGSYAAGLTLHVVHSFTAPGTVVLSAAHGGALAVTPRVRYRSPKIIAVEASDIPNAILGDNWALAGARRQNRSLRSGCRTAALTSRSAESAGRGPYRGAARRGAKGLRRETERR
jgi:hypothetical protein